MIETLRHDGAWSDRDGTVWKHPQAVLTDDERRDLKIAADAYADNDDDSDCERIAATLRGLLERLR